LKIGGSLVFVYFSKNPQSFDSEKFKELKLTILSKLEGLPNTSLYIDWHNKAFLTHQYTRWKCFLNDFDLVDLVAKPITRT